MESSITFTNNVDIDREDGTNNFANIANNNFQLITGSKAIDCGVEIDGITNNFKGSAPDVGCYELGVEPWSCGADLTQPTYLDEKGEIWW